MPFHAPDEKSISGLANGSDGYSRSWCPASRRRFPRWAIGDIVLFITVSV
jgi:hypothetical protein